MSATNIVWALLSANANLIAAIPASQIMVGTIPLEYPLPAISITEVDSIERVSLSMRAPTIIKSSRVQVTAFFKTSSEGTDYDGLKAALELVRLALPNMRAQVGGYAVDSILPSVTGPEFEDTDLRLLTQSKDFMVQFYVQGA